MAEVAHGRATHEAVGRLEADGADATVTELLGNFGHHRDLLTFEHDVELDGRVQLGQCAARELDVDDGTRDADDAAVLEIGG